MIRYVDESIEYFRLDGGVDLADEGLSDLEWWEWLLIGVGNLKNDVW